MHRRLASGECKSILPNTTKQAPVLVSSKSIPLKSKYFKCRLVWYVGNIGIHKIKWTLGVGLRCVDRYDAVVGVTRCTFMG